MSKAPYKEKDEEIRLLTALKKAKATERKHQGLMETARREASEAKEKYLKLICTKLGEELLKLEWAWPGKTGRRVLKAELGKRHPIISLIKPLTSTWLHRIKVRPKDGPAAIISIRFEEYNNNFLDNKKGQYYVTIPGADANRLGIKRTRAKPSTDWAKMRKQLKDAGVTDTAQLQALMKKAKR